MKQNINQDTFLIDKSSTGKVRDWQGKKQRNLTLSKIYEMIKEFYRHSHSEKFNRFLNRSDRSRMCATQLTFAVDDKGNKKLHEGYFCQLPLCPICSWRRSLKIYSQVTKILDAMKKEKDYAYIFLTLTQKNVSAEELPDELDKMMKAWHRFLGYKRVKDVILGSYRGLEVTYNNDVKSPSYDTYHPHFHVLIAVDNKYFKSRKYLSQEAWRDLWAKAMRLDYMPQVNVKKVKGNTAKAVAEVAKYAAKDGDFIIETDMQLSANVVEVLDYAFERRRLVAFTGVMKEWHKKLNLSDIEDGDLVHIDDENIGEIDLENLRIVTYAWNTGYMNYIKTSNNEF